VADDLADLLLRDEGALHPQRLARPHRQEERIPLPDQLLRARLVEDDPAVGQAGGGEREPGRDVRLDQAGDDVDAGPLGGHHQVDAGRARQLGDPHDRVFHIPGGDHHQVGELVHDHQQVRVGRKIRSLPGGAVSLPARTALLKSSMCRNPDAARSS
jgi:hypothetical protein